MKHNFAGFLGVFDAIEKAANTLSVFDKTYIVGGFVRDFQLGRQTSDVDILVDGPGLGIELAKQIARDTGAKDVAMYAEFGTAMVDMLGHKVEFIHPRKESYKVGSRKPATEAATLLEDAQRRDFTINTLLWHLNSGTIVDITNRGLSDLKNRLIRCANPNYDITMSDDPLRMLRAIRFKVQLNFSVEEKTIAAIKRNAHRLAIISMERVQEEFSKMLLSDHPVDAIDMLRSSGLLTYMIPEVYEMLAVEQNDKWHSKDVYRHTMKVLQKTPPILQVRLAALLHDIAKPRTKSVTESGIHFYQHDMVGGDMARQILTRLKYSNDIIEDVSWLVTNHLRPNFYDETWSDSSVRRLVRDAGHRLEWLLELSKADITSSREDRQLAAAATNVALREHIKRVEEIQESAKIRPLIDGNKLQEIFARGPGKWIKVIQDALLERQLENPQMSMDEALMIAEQHYEKAN